MSICLHVDAPYEVVAEVIRNVQTVETTVVQREKEKTATPMCSRCVQTQEQQVSACLYGKALCVGNGRHYL